MAENPQPSPSRRRLVVTTADYWYQHACDPSYSMADRLLFMVNALNHTENALIEELRQQGKPLHIVIRGAADGT